MAKLLLSVICLSIIVILLTITMTAQGKFIAENSTTTAPVTGIESTVTQQPEIKTTPKPSANASWSAATLMAGNGTVFIDKDHLNFTETGHGYDKELLNKLERTTKYWFDQSQMTLKERLYQKPNTNIAKNIVYFLGDGMSLNTIAAARIFHGQLNGKNGEENSLWFQKFPYSGLSKTYCLDSQTADSACSATAYLSGVKANMLTLGVNGQVLLDDCEASNNPENHVYSLLRWAQLSGKSTGFVTNTRVTHATPAAVYSHISNRIYESDHDVHKIGADPKKCIDIGRQLIESETGRQLNVVMGGGQIKLLPNTTFDSRGKRGERHDGRNLINEWISDRKNSDCAYVTNRESLLKVDYSKTKNLLGLFASGHMEYHSDRNVSIEPTLTEMTEMAINILSKNENGYVLFVEGGLIDVANHITLAQKALIETCELDEAIKMSDLKTNEKDTMIIVTSDHSHTMQIAGYPERGANVLGTMKNLNELVKPADIENYDNKSMSIITYSYGPGYFYNHDDNGDRIDLDKVTIDKNFQYITSVGSAVEPHGSDDVGIFARGPFAHLLSGVVEQNFIPHVCAYAACLGPKGTSNRCNE